MEETYEILKVLKKSVLSIEFSRTPYQKRKRNARHAQQRRLKPNTQKNKVHKWKSQYVREESTVINSSFPTCGGCVVVKRYSPCLSRLNTTFQRTVSRKKL